MAVELIQRRGAERVKRIAKLSAPFWMPWVLVVGSYQLALLLPGTFRVAHWKLFCAVCFVAAGLAALAMIWRNGRSVIARIGISALVLPVFFFLALILSARSRCGDEPTFIGPSTKSQVASSCAQ